MTVTSLLTGWLRKSIDAARPLPASGPPPRVPASVRNDDPDHAARVAQFRFNEAMLANTAYLLNREGGYREDILTNVFGFAQDQCADARLGAWYNPIPTIVDAYQNVFRGPFGQEVKVADEVDGREVNPKLTDGDGGQVSPIRLLWRWSNLDTTKQAIQEWAANLGTVILRVTSDAERGRVMVLANHPSYLNGYAADERGNVVEAELFYPATQWRLGQGTVNVEVREVFTKTRYLRELNGKRVVDIDNPLGVCPIVILRHNDDGHEIGRWAWYGSEEIIHGLNWLASNQAESINEHIWPTWFGAAGGKAPESVTVGRHSMNYVELQPDTPTPFIEALVPNLDYAGSLTFQQELWDRLQARQPEIVLGNIKALSGQSGETIAKLQIAAEARIEQAKANYEHALIRAMQIGLSEGIRLGLWELGTGTGTVEAADRAYDSGKEDFAFAPRPALPQTVFDKLSQAQLQDAEQQSKFKLAKAAQDIGVPLSKRLELAGFDEEETAAMVKEKQAEDAAAQSNAAGGVDPRVAKGIARITRRAGR